jgi:hypothetical protein
LASRKKLSQTASSHTDTNAEESDPIALCKYATDNLTILLSSENLTSELTLLPAVSVPTSKSYLAPVDIIAMILQQRIHGQRVDRLAHDTFDDTGATTVLTHIVSTVSVLHSFASNYADICLTKRFMSWEIARSLSIVSRWYTDTGPMLAEYLFDAHRQGGRDELEEKFPSFSKLVEHIMQYIKAVHASKRTSHTRKRPKVVPDSDRPSFEELRRLHLDVFGSQFTSNQSQSINLPLIKPYSIGASEEKQYSFGQQCFIQVVSDVFISPNLISIDAQLNGPGRRVGATQSKLNVLEGCVKRSIIRGAVIDAIVEACDGDDGILSSSAIENILRSPAFLFDMSPKHHTNDDIVTNKLLKDPTTTLAPIRTWLKNFIASSPDTLPCVKKLGDAVYDLIYQRHGPKPFPRFNPLQALPRAKPRRPFGGRLSKTPLLDIPLTPNALLKHPDGDVFSQLAVIIREVLNRHRALPIGDIHLDRLMSGHHPTTGRASRCNLDHFNPIRFNNVYTQMLKKQFTANRLTSKWFLTNLLVWMSTGQGFMTQEFFNRSTLWFESLHDCIQTFRDGLAGHSQSYDTRIWGTTCASFAVETETFTLEEKFTPFFSDEVLEAWQKYLGERYESNDTTFSEEQLPTFTEALDMIKDLNKKIKLNGFKRGLTNLQFANNLVCLGRCQPPTVGEIADWIFKNPKKGAFKGLVALGFNIVGRPAHWTKAAFQVVLDHLQATLSLEDRNLLVFGTIFLEHVLCKVSRFAYLIRKTRRKRKQQSIDEGEEMIDEGLSLKRIGAQAAQEMGSSWISGANLLDQTGKILPIPVKCDTSRLQASVQLWA